jgi:hypothetical protein
LKGEKKEEFDSQKYVDEQKLIWYEEDLEKARLIETEKEFNSQRLQNLEKDYTKLKKKDKGKNTEPPTQD